MNALRNQYNHKAAVLDCCFVTNTLAASGGLDRAVMTYVPAWLCCAKLIRLFAIAALLLCCMSAFVRCWARPAGWGVAVARRCSHSLFIVLLCVVQQ